MEEVVAPGPEYEQCVRDRFVDMASAYGGTKLSVSFNRRGQIPLLLLPQFTEFPSAQLCAMSHFQPQVSKQGWVQMGNTPF